MDSAIQELKSASKTNYAAVARKWGVSHQTLRRRFLGLTDTIARGYQNRQKLDPELERILI